jgi:hypothetical protein
MSRIPASGVRTLGGLRGRDDDFIQLARTLKVEHTNRLRDTARKQARIDIVNWTEGSYDKKIVCTPHRSSADCQLRLKA